ncbi:PREDICTED: dihydrolipoyllysine-residue acetyltransferase component 4 of pyruvate dehydrogenase complex, chloroplastic [Prunus mume]|uniref:Dihydrolipoyllysine-residue acetyltransferase component 4 of pyruvate dehydrogenase complex, chloroplastic n=1 Tax=Prunus mume TaxID=102107 RepID=A0ABM0PR47_PRUMU|nr:PREDICTED: dihydrolipoyllysine-residue acetyltransferase component 4 of pyruvate dehydrogenase complex, chloroplastic [Prunus mume]
MASSPFLSKTTISFSSSISTSLPWRSSHSSPSFSTAFRTKPRRRNLTVQSKIREIFMPALSSTMTEGKIVSWVKSEGDVLETFYDGILAAIVVGEGETAPVGSAIGLLAETEEEVAEAKAKAKSASSDSPASSSPAAEAVTPTPPPATSTPAPAIAQPSPPATYTPKKTVATPFAKKLAKQHKVDIASVVGSGPFGRITPADVEAAAGIAQPKKTVAAEPTPVSAAPPKPSAAPSASSAPLLPGSTVVPFTTMQAAVSKNMLESLSVPTFRVGYPISTDALDALYEKVKPKGVTMTALLAKAAALALAQHPVVNASCKDGKSFTYNSSINIAVAVAINGGLITPVLQDADKLDLYLLSQKWKELVEKARAKQLQPHEYSSGTFTLSNLGMFGVDRFDAILPPGQGAIMAVGASKPTVVADADGFFSVKSKMLVNVTADHRIVYGADLAAFLKTFAKIVENPESLTL